MRCNARRLVKRGSVRSAFPGAFSIRRSCGKHLTQVRLAKLCSGDSPSQQQGPSRTTQGLRSLTSEIQTK